MQLGDNFKEIDMTEETGFTFGSWNAGANKNDYLQLIPDGNSAEQNWSYLTNKDNPDAPALQASMEKARNAFLEDTAKDLAGAADVYALQEVNGDDRPDITAFTSAGFRIIRPPRKDPKYASKTDTAIAIHPKKFAEITDRSFNEIAVAVATEKSTGRKIAFISGHIPGFELESNPEHSEADIGDNLLKDAIAKLNKACADCDSVIFGADMNASPEIYNQRFELLEKAGFKLHRTHAPTSHMSRNIKNKTPQLQDRELDYIFVRDQQPIKPKPSRLSGFLSKLFKKEKVDVVQLVKDRTSLSLRPNSCPSDHIPVFLKVDQVVLEKRHWWSNKSIIPSIFKRNTDRNTEIEL